MTRPALCAALLAVPFLSTAARSQALCEGGTPIDVARPFAGTGSGAQHIWGKPDVEPLGGDGVRVRFAAGSANPADKGAPPGGAGFELPIARGTGRRCLSYEVRFAPDFAFNKGGKLPGLYGGDAPRGCTPAALSAGFSARLMWRADGDGELYLYAPGRAVRCGDSVDRGAWRFKPGAWARIAEEVTLNAPGQDNGRIRVAIDGRIVIDRGGLLLREQASVGADGLLFATFFGGNDPSWAAPKDQFVEFRRFTVRDLPATP